MQLKRGRLDGEDEVAMYPGKQQKLIAFECDEEYDDLLVKLKEAISSRIKTGKHALVRQVLGPHGTLYLSVESTLKEHFHQVEEQVAAVDGHKIVPILLKEQKKLALVFQHLEKGFGLLSSDLEASIYKHSLDLWHKLLNDLGSKISTPILDAIEKDRNGLPVDTSFMDTVYHLFEGFDLYIARFHESFGQVKRVFYTRMAEDMAGGLRGGPDLVLSLARILGRENFVKRKCEITGQQGKLNAFKCQLITLLEKDLEPSVQLLTTSLLDTGQTSELRLVHGIFKHSSLLSKAISLAFKNHVRLASGFLHGENPGPQMDSLGWLQMFWAGWAKFVIDVFGDDANLWRGLFDAVMEKGNISKHVKDEFKGIVLSMFPFLHDDPWGENVPHDLIERITRFAVQADKRLREKLRVLNKSWRSALRKFKLLFHHECRAQSCSDVNCHLCENNPLRPCGDSILRAKYCVSEIMSARCGAPIKLQLVDKDTGELIKSNATVEVRLLEAHAFAQQFPNGIPHCADAGVARCSLSTARALVPWLTSKQWARKLDGRLEIQLQGGEVTLDIEVRRPINVPRWLQRGPFQLYVGVPEGGPLDPISVQPAVCPEGFNLTWRRSKLAPKNHIPTLSDPVSKLWNVGLKRQQNFAAVGNAIREHTSWRNGSDGSETLKNIPEKVETVAEFRNLARLIEGEPRLQRMVRRVMKMSEEQWNDACDHAKKALPADDYLRVWWCGPKWEPELGLLYACRRGDVFLSRPLGVIQMDETGERHVAPCKNPGLDTRIMEIHREAFKNWAKAGHPGWDTLQFDSKEFKKNPKEVPLPDPILGNPFDEISSPLSNYSSDIAPIGALVDFECTFQDLEDIYIEWSGH